MKNQFSYLKHISCLLLVAQLFTGCVNPSGGDGKEEESVVNRTPQLYTVEIRQMAFVPDMLNVKKGDKVTFINRDLVTHDVTEELSKAWTSSPLASQESWTLEVKESANYYCSLHPIMKGRILIE